MTFATIEGEWLPDLAAGIRRVPSGEKGIYPECSVDGLPVLVLWAGNTLDMDRLTRTFRESAGPEAIVIACGPGGGEGWIEVDARFVGVRRREASIAAAIVKAGWGWDESEAIRVDDADGSVRVSVRYDAGNPPGWHVRVADDSDT